MLHSLPSPYHCSAPQERTAAWGEWLQRYRAKLAAQGLPAAERAAMQVRPYRLGGPHADLHGIGWQPVVPCAARQRGASAHNQPLHPIGSVVLPPPCSSLLRISLPSLQDAANPAIIPRNHVMVDIIGEAETGNYEPLHRWGRAPRGPAPPRCAACTRGAQGACCRTLDVA